MRNLNSFICRLPTPDDVAYLETYHRRSNSSTLLLSSLQIAAVPSYHVSKTSAIYTLVYQKGNGVLAIPVSVDPRTGKLTETQNQDAGSRSLLIYCNLD
jgi:hypothetical protein